MSHADLAAAAAALGEARPLLLVLDFDGVLSEIVDDPWAAAMVDGLDELLVSLQGAPETTVVVSSGRELEDLASRVPETLVEAGVGLVGGHGTAVQLPGTDASSLVDGPDLSGVLDAIQDDLEALVAGADGFWVERKRVSVGVHYRRAPEAEVGRTLSAVRERLAAACDEPPGWSVLDGKDIVELRPDGHDKGSALRWLLETHAPRHVPYAIGDDVTDEDAFEVAVALGGGAVLVAPEPRETAASWRLKDPTEVRELLTRVARSRA